MRNTPEELKRFRDLIDESLRTGREIRHTTWAAGMLEEHINFGSPVEQYELEPLKPPPVLWGEYRTSALSGDIYRLVPHADTIQLIDRDGGVWEAAISVKDVHNITPDEWLCVTANSPFELVTDA